MRLVLVLGDQLSPNLSALRKTDKATDVVVMAEVMGEATYVPHHPKKIAFTFMAMSFICLMSYGLLANKAKNWFAHGNRATWFNRTLGSVFIAIGAGVLTLKLER